MSGLWVYGAGGHGRVVADVARSAGWEVTGFIDDADVQRAVNGLRVLTLPEVLEEPDEPLHVALGVGDNMRRQACFDRIGRNRLSLDTLVHARATISPSATLDVGVVVMPGAVINANARVGRGVVVNTSAVVEHDCLLGEFSLLGPGATLGGGARIGAFTLVGLGASVRPGTRIGIGATIGVGAAVVSDIRDGQTVTGVPAR